MKRQTESKKQKTGQKQQQTKTCKIPIQIETKSWTDVRSALTKQQED